MPDPSRPIAPSATVIDPADAARVGKVIAEKYRIIRVLGAGGMGAVYEARNTWTNRRVAIKVLRAGVAASADAVRRFKQEAQAATAIAHPNIVDVLDMGPEADGALFIVQEYLDGMDLRGLLEVRGHLAVRESIEIIVPIMDALVAAHQRGVVHRDIKPENIFLANVNDHGVVPKLIDFGVSKFNDPNGESLSMTTTGIAIGTPYYMSPEQARGDVVLDARTDIWSLGAVIFEMLVGRSPYEAPNYNLLITKIITEAPPRIDTYAPELPADVVAVVHRALEKERDARFDSMRAMRDALTACAVARAAALPFAGTGRYRTDEAAGDAARKRSDPRLPLAVLPGDSVRASSETLMAPISERRPASSRADTRLERASGASGRPRASFASWPGRWAIGIATAIAIAVVTVVVVHSTMAPPPQPAVRPTALPVAVQQVPIVPRPAMPVVDAAVEPPAVLARPTPSPHVRVMTPAAASTRAWHGAHPHGAPLQPIGRYQ